MELVKSLKTMFPMIYIINFAMIQIHLIKIIIQFWEILKIIQRF